MHLTRNVTTHRSDAAHNFGDWPTGSVDSNYAFTAAFLPLFFNLSV